MCLLKANDEEREEEANDCERVCESDCVFLKRELPFLIESFLKKASYQKCCRHIIGI